MEEEMVSAPSRYKEGLKLKLMVDSSKSQVIFAEAGKEMVDVLFQLLNLPIVSAIHLLSTSTTPTKASCLINLYDSVANLSSEYLQNPQHYGSSTDTTSEATADNNIPSNYFMCCVCRETFFRDVGPNTVCSGFKCIKTYIGGLIPSSSEPARARDVPYIVTDDLKVVPSSASMCLSLLGDSNVTDLKKLEERIVDVTFRKCCALLNGSLNSHTVLTHVFLHGRHLFPSVKEISGV